MCSVVEFSIIRPTFLFIDLLICCLSVVNASLYADFNEDDSLALHLLPFVILLGHSNSAVNPLLYCLMTRHLHRGRSTIHQGCRSAVDLAKPSPAVSAGDYVTLQLLGEAAAGQRGSGMTCG